MSLVCDGGGAGGMYLGLHSAQGGGGGVGVEDL